MTTDEIKVAAEALVNQWVGSEEQNSPDESLGQLVTAIVALCEQVREGDATYIVERGEEYRAQGERWHEKAISENSPFKELDEYDRDQCLAKHSACLALAIAIRAGGKRG